MPRISSRSLLAAAALVGALGVGAVVATPAGSAPETNTPVVRPTGDELGPVSEDEVMIGDAPILPPPVVEPADG